VAPDHGTTSRIANANAALPTSSLRAREPRVEEQQRVGRAPVVDGRTLSGWRARSQARLWRARALLASIASARR